MAHFAELDSNNIVLRVVVVGNDIAANGGTLGDNDMHADGEAWCINFFKGGIWKQTSYNNNFRKQYCGKGYTYDPTKNKFIAEKIYPSWALDVNDDWRSPVTEPTIKTYGSNDPLDRYNISWNEENLKWIAKDSENPANNFNWDASALTWVPA
tara:strand:+ start:157 stop:615 length:459 start_codon:yes stop_codon:yes gene_type:complete